MKPYRLARVAEAVREVASETILYEMHDPRVKQVSCSLTGEWQNVEILRAGGETVLAGRILAGRLTHGALGCSCALCAASASHATAHSANRQSVIRQPPKDRRVTPCLIHLNVTGPIL